MQRLLVVLLVSGATQAHARDYVVRWAGERTSLVEQFDRHLKAELLRRGDTVVDEARGEGAIVLQPTVVLSGGALVLEVVGVMARSHALLGAVRTRAKVRGLVRDAVVQALVLRSCSDARFGD